MYYNWITRLIITADVGEINTSDNNKANSTEIIFHNKIKIKKLQ